MVTFPKLFCYLISFLISFGLCGNGLDVKNQLLLMPMPKKVTANYNSPDSVIVTPSLSYIVGTNCNDKCKDFLNDNFNHTITTTLKRQEGLDDFKVSLHRSIDIPHYIPKQLATVDTVSIELITTDVFSKIPKAASDVFPKLNIGIDESYTLIVNKDGIAIRAANVYGIRHGLETLIQLVRISEDKQFYIAQIPIEISDAPRFKWRGLMVDPARNVLSPPTFYKIIDSLASIKCNVLHIHLTDGQTFAFESKDYPELSKKGMFEQSKVLTQKIVKEIADYGRKRGVIVYGEVDVPGHAAAWGLGYPEIVANSWDYLVNRNFIYGENIPCLNPASEKTWKVLSSVLREVGDTFGNDFVHVGGDEVRTTAWTEAKEAQAIKDYMTSHSISSYKELESQFNKFAQEEVIKNNKTPIAWEDVYLNNAASKDTIIHVWSDIRLLSTLTSEGYKGIFSTGFYLDRQVPLCVGHDPQKKCSNSQYMWVWVNRDFYYNDPVRSLSPAQIENVYGGEGCSWGESCDDQNFFDRVFQRFSAIAERFWSESRVSNPNSHEVRANYVRCLDLRRGFYKGTGPLYHSYCQHIEE